MAAVVERLAARAAARPYLVIRVEVEEVFFHCAKAFLRSRLWQPDAWGEPHKVSFGKMLRQTQERTCQRLPPQWIEASIERDYRENL